MVNASVQPQEENHPLFVLGRKIEELFAQQYDRIAFHNNDQENGYRWEEERLSSLMLDRTLPNEKHLEHAQAMLALTEKYTSGFVQSLRSLNADIERHLAAFEHSLDAISSHVREPTAEVASVLESHRRWLSLSKDLHQARLVATQTVVMRVHCDKEIPNAIIKHDGRADISFAPEEGERFQQILADVSEMLKQSFADNERIQQERLRLTQVLFRSQETTNDAKPPTEPKSEAQIQRPKSLHPLEGKAWFRLFKIAYISLWILAAGLCLILAFSGAGGSLAIGTGVVSAVLLILSRKGFYYVMLGRTTVTEQPGTGFLDWDELNSDCDSIKASNPEFYQAVARPFLSSWKEQYGRRVPIHAYEVFRKRVTTELEELRTKKQKLIDDAAKKGAKIEISVLRENMEKTKAEYQGPDRAAYVRGIDDWILRLEAQYGTCIPVDEASKVLDELEVRIRDREEQWPQIACG